MHSICKIGATLGLFKCEKKVSTALESKFYNHVSAYGLSYATQEEFQFRLNEFQKRDASLEKINSEQSSFTVGHNQFSTWTDAEYRRILGEKGSQPKSPEYTTLNTTDLPDSVNWITKGAVNPVKDQGHCGSCWTFAATAVSEGHHFIASGDLLNLSEQMFVDCEPVGEGCNGGMAYDALNYLLDHKHMLESDYPYKAVDGKCAYDADKGIFNSKKVSLVPPHSVEALKAAIAQGPTGVSVMADNDVFRHYTSGVMDSVECGVNTDHAITAVGYGVEDGKEYYLVRNSWSATWGDKGYIKIGAVDGIGICAIQAHPVWATTY